MIGLSVIAAVAGASFIVAWFLVRYPSIKWDPFMEKQPAGPWIWHLGVALVMAGFSVAIVLIKATVRFDPDAKGRETSRSWLFWGEVAGVGAPAVITGLASPHSKLRWIPSWGAGLVLGTSAVLRGQDWASTSAPEDDDSESGQTHTVIEIPGSTDTLVLLDHTRAPQVFDNLARLRLNGAEAWSAHPPLESPPDYWIDARLDGDEIVARSWSGYIVRLDLASGEERSREFTN